jgi:hypothetical protein
VDLSCGAFAGFGNHSPRLAFTIQAPQKWYR